MQFRSLPCAQTRKPSQLLEMLGPLEVPIRRVNQELPYDNHLIYIMAHASGSRAGVNKLIVGTILAGARRTFVFILPCPPI